MTFTYRHPYFILLAVLLVSCTPDPKQEAEVFLNDYNGKFQNLYYETQKAQWLANTDISPAHDSLSEVKEKEYSTFVGSKEVIQKVRGLIAQKDKLTPLQVAQLNKILLAAAHRPATIPDVVEQLISAGTKAVAPGKHSTRTSALIASLTNK